MKAGKTHLVNAACLCLSSNHLNTSLSPSRTPKISLATL